MAGNTIPTNKAQQAKPTDPKQATQQAPKNHEGMPDSQAQQNQSNPSSRRPVPGRPPLFGR